MFYILKVVMIHYYCPKKTEVVIHMSTMYSEAYLIFNNEMRLEVNN